MTDQQLMSAFVDTRDVDSLKLFFGRYQDRLFRFAVRMLSDESAAQDVVQQTFLRVAGHPKRLLGVQSCHNWLIRVARNLCIGRIRKRPRGRPAPTRLAEESGRRIPTPERQETHQAVRRAIQSLRPLYRELVILKIQEGKSYREIAEITGLSVTSVGYLLHQAMKALLTMVNGLEAP